MTISKTIRSVAAVSALSLALVACDQAQDIADMANAVAAGGMNIEDGTDVCAKAVADKIGADAKVSDLQMVISAGTEVNPDAFAPAGEVISCQAYYQDPEDPRKLLGIVYASTTGMFTEPAPVEISVSGDSEDFNLEDVLIPLSEVNTAAIADFMASNKEALDEKYSAHGYTVVQLAEPGENGAGFSQVILNEGRLKSNDVLESGRAVLSLDGTVIENDLVD